LKVGAYSLVIEKQGYEVRKIPAIRTEEDVNLGDIELKSKSK
jgi:hypothetical protein